MIDGAARAVIELPNICSIIKSIQSFYHLKPDIITHRQVFISALKTLPALAVKPGCKSMARPAR